VTVNNAGGGVGVSVAPTAATVTLVQGGGGPSAQEKSFMADMAGAGFAATDLADGSVDLVAGAVFEASAQNQNQFTFTGTLTSAFGTINLNIYSYYQLYIFDNAIDQWERRNQSSGSFGGTTYSLQDVLIRGTCQNNCATAPPSGRGDWKTPSWWGYPAPSRRWSSTWGMEC
jgi:hypothetical protein